MAEIVLYPRNEATKIVLGFAEKIVGTKVLLLRAPLQNFLQALYTEGMILASADEVTRTLMTEKASGKPRINCNGIVFSFHESAKTYLLYQAEIRGLPVAVIKQDFIRLVDELHATGHMIGVAATPTVKDKLAQLSVVDKRATLTLKTEAPEPQTNVEKAL